MRPTPARSSSNRPRTQMWTRGPTGYVVTGTVAGMTGRPGVSSRVSTAIRYVA